MEDRHITVYNSRQSYGKPSIILQGAWLEAAGFAPGDKIKVVCQDNQLNILLEEKFSQRSDITHK